MDKLNSDINETKSLLQKNCDKIIERDNNLSDIDAKAAALNLSSTHFKKNSTKLKNKLWWNEKMIPIIILFLLIIIITIIVLTNK